MDPNQISQYMDNIHQTTAGLADLRHRENNPQIAAFERFLEIVDAFRENLDDDHDLGAHVASSEDPFHVVNVEQKGSLFLFHGTDKSGQEVLAVQHYTQLNFRLVRLKKLKTSRPLGFTSDL